MKNFGLGKVFETGLIHLYFFSIWNNVNIMLLHSFISKCNGKDCRHSRILNIMFLTHNEDQKYTSIAYASVIHFK